MTVLERETESLYQLVENIINSLDSTRVHKDSTDITSNFEFTIAEICQRFLPILINEVFPVTTPSTYPLFVVMMKTMLWSCPLEIFDYFDLFTQFCINCLKTNPFQYSPIFRVLSDFIGVNNENPKVEALLSESFSTDFLKLANIMGSTEQEMEKFCEVLPELLNLLSTLLLFDTNKMLSDKPTFLQLTANLARVYEQYNNAEVKSAILVFWNTCLSLEQLYRNSEELQAAMQTIVATPLACIRNLPSVSMTHSITKIYTSSLLRPSGRRQQLQTPREMERERTAIEQAVVSGVARISGLSDKDKEIVVGRLLGSKDVD